MSFQLKPQPVDVNVLLSKLSDIKKEKDEYTVKINLLKSRIKVLDNEAECLRSKLDKAIAQSK
jgi:hypothetical protein